MSVTVVGREAWRYLSVYLVGRGEDISLQLVGRSGDICHCSW